ncbi:alpha/beta hydrolase [Pseudooceanicola sp. MF1-13]|uniref:alpha/beta hydrolase n=1 Tax=Pseudooceanicola sp. MF1-13 TaxID=3379095 RepID=UPI00389296E5
MKTFGIAAFCVAGLVTPAAAQVSATPEVAGQLAALGKELSREMVGGTMKLYGPLHATETDEGLTVERDISYGGHERQKLDIFAPEDTSVLKPVMVFAHGGGFVRGDKGGAQNIGRAFAREGVVTITMNYRFAPEATWPSGAEDVSGVLSWIAENAQSYGGDPDKVFLSGNSAGSVHVADYAFHEEFQREDDGVIGVILISPPAIDLTGRELDPQRDALYFGPDGDRAAQSIINALDGRKLPVLIAYAENEPELIMNQTRILIDGLTARDGRLPLVTGVPGHNHISIVEHIGTADQSLTTDMLDFIKTVEFTAE